MEISMINVLIVADVFGAIMSSLIDPTGSFIILEDDTDFRRNSHEENEVTQKRKYFVNAIKFIGLVIGHSIFVFTWILVLIHVTQESRKLKDLKIENGEMKADMVALLRLTNVIFFNSDVKIKKQSVLARVFFSYEDLKKYKWRNRNDHDEFWEDESLTKFVLNDGTEDEYFLIEDRVRFFRDNFPRKMEDLNRKYILWADGNPFDADAISDDQIKVFQKRFDKMT